MSLLNKVREICAEKNNDNATTRKNKTKQPIYSRAEQKKLLARIALVLPTHNKLFWMISTETGWRTTDVLELKYENIDFNTGHALIEVNKQTKSAQARAYRKELKEFKHKLKKQASADSDYDFYMKIDMCELDNIIKLATEAQAQELELKLVDAVNNAPVKHDKKKLSQKVLEILSYRFKKEGNDNAGFIFYSALCKSNRSKNFKGHISRQTMWTTLKVVFTWFNKKVNSTLKLSVYSSRKIFAYRMLKGVNNKENNIAEVMESFGHSSVKMTFKYLCLESNADKLQQSLLTV